MKGFGLYQNKRIWIILTMFLFSVSLKLYAEKEQHKHLSQLGQDKRLTIGARIGNFKSVKDFKKTKILNNRGLMVDASLGGQKFKYTPKLIVED
jgi:hypothetical protein